MLIAQRLRREHPRINTKKIQVQNVQYFRREGYSRCIDVTESSLDDWAADLSPTVMPIVFYGVNTNLDIAWNYAHVPEEFIDSQGTITDKYYSWAVEGCRSGVKHTKKSAFVLWEGEQYVGVRAFGKFANLYIQWVEKHPSFHTLCAVNHTYGGNIILQQKNDMVHADILAGLLKSNYFWS